MWDEITYPFLNFSGCTVLKKYNVFLQSLSFHDAAKTCLNDFTLYKCILIKNIPVSEKASCLLASNPLSDIVVAECYCVLYHVIIISM